MIQSNDISKGKGKAKTPSPTKGSGASEAGSSGMSQRPAWNSSPLRNPPGSLNGLNPVTKEPWQEIAKEDMAIRMNFGSRDALGLPEYEDAPNGLVLEAKHKRAVKAAAAVPWNQDIVRHMPPVLRGQKVVRRAEPWNEDHDDSIDELNVVDGTSINELYAVTADRENRVKHTITQPAWDQSIKLGKRSKKQGVEKLEAARRAQTFREQRRMGTRAGAPVIGSSRGAAGGGGGGGKSKGGKDKEPTMLS